MRFPWKRRMKPSLSGVTIPAAGVYRFACRSSSSEYDMAIVDEVGRAFGDQKSHWLLHLTPGTYYMVPVDAQTPPAR